MIEGGTIDDALEVAMELLPHLSDALGPPVEMDVRATLEDIADTGALFIQPGGVIGGCIAPSPINSSHLFCGERVFYARSGHRDLIGKLEAWAAQAGARTVVMGTPSARMGAIYARLGYSPLEGYHAKAIGG